MFITFSILLVVPLYYSSNKYDLIFYMITKHILIYASFQDTKNAINTLARFARHVSIIVNKYKFHVWIKLKFYLTDMNLRHGQRGTQNSDAPDIFANLIHVPYVSKANILVRHSIQSAANKLKEYNGTSLFGNARQGRDSSLDNWTLVYLHCYSYSYLRTVLLMQDSSWRDGSTKWSNTHGEYLTTETLDRRSDFKKWNSQNIVRSKVGTVCAIVIRNDISNYLITRYIYHEDNKHIFDYKRYFLCVSYKITI